MGLSRSLIKNNSCSSFFTPKNSSLSTKNTTMSFFSHSRYSSVSSTQRSINSPKNYFLNPPMKSIELMIPKNNVVINKNNFKLRKKVLDINKAISLNENSHIGNNKNENNYYSNEIIWGDSEHITGSANIRITASSHGKRFLLSSSLDNGILKTLYSSICTSILLLVYT